MKIEKGFNYREDIIGLLTAEKLPVEDLPSSLDNFFVALHNKELIGVAGLEIYGTCGLLRSLAVRSDFRNRGIGDELLQSVYGLSNLRGLQEIYLLTETASGYFARKGYRTIARTNVPTVLQESSEFSHVCPQSAIVMQMAF